MSPKSSILLAFLCLATVASVVCGAPTKEAQLESDLTSKEEPISLKLTSQADLDQFFKDQAHLFDSAKQDTGLLGQPANVGGILDQIPLSQVLPQFNQITTMLSILNQLSLGSLIDPTALINSLPTELGEIISQFIARQYIIN